MDGHDGFDGVRPDDDERVMCVLPRVTTAVAEARDWLGAFLKERSVSERAVEDAVLVTSELVTNALRHGLGEVVVRASTDGDEQILVAVSDSGREMPVLLEPDPERVGGVGLRIVDELALRWGTSPFPGGKTVWVVLRGRRPSA
jgi:anti-sigma regulatory factor (Ser/Thr protein kinase)